MDENNNSSNSVEKMIRSIANLIKDTGKILKVFVKWIGGFISSLLPYILIFIAIIICLLAVISIVVMIFSGGYDKALGLMSSIGGVKGDMFYGTRYVYYDDAYTTVDLEDKYLEFTYNIMVDLKNDNKSTFGLIIDNTKNYNEISEIKTFCLSFTKFLAQEALIKENKDYGVINQISDYTRQVDHYGFTSSEIEDVVKSLSISTASYWASGTNIESKILSSFTKPEFDYMKNVCSKILIKDYIVDVDETASDIPKKNYVGFVYMPKQSVVFNESSFVFGVEEGKQVQISGNYKSNTTHEEISNDTADHTWFNGEGMEKSFKCELANYTFNQFTAIDTSNINYLSESKTLFDICRDGKYDIYFKTGINKQNINELMENINTSNYFYLKLNSDSPYNMAESYVEYE